MIKVLLVDDHQIVIDGIQSLLKDAPGISCQGWANSGQEALDLLVDIPVDVVLLDINMPEMDGLKTCQLILQQHPAIKVIALTMLSERSMIKAMVNNGAKGYLLKNVGREELIRAISRVFRGKSHYSDDIADIILHPELDKKKESPGFIVSRREKQILQLIINELTTQEIAEKLFISENTVETHRRNIMKKLGARNTAGMVRIALENKLVDQ